MTTKRKLGRLPNSGRPRLRLTSTHRPPAYTPPPSVDRYSGVPDVSWGMDGNDAVGDCTCADIDHEVKAVQVAAGNPETVSTAAEVLSAYSAITGYNPADPSTDQGAEMQSVREYWQRTGFTLGGVDHKVLLFAELDVHDEHLVQWALDKCGAVGVGVNLPAIATHQFDNGLAWDVVPDDGGIEGGHAVALVGYDQRYVYLVTWGRVQKATWAWWAAYVEEAWLSLTEDFVNTHTGTDALGQTLYQLGQEFADITGKPNPVPAPTPSPSPEPTPTPAPDAADMALVATLGPWSRGHHIGGNEVAAKAFQVWAKTNGYM